MSLCFPLWISRKEVDRISMCLCLCVFVFPPVNKVGMSWRWIEFLYVCVFLSLCFPLWISRKEVEVDSKRKEECWQSPPHSSWWLDYSVWGKNCHQGLGQWRRRRSVAQSDAQSVAQREEGRRVAHYSRHHLKHWPGTYLADTLHKYSPQLANNILSRIEKLSWEARVRFLLLLQFLQVH